MNRSARKIAQRRRELGWTQKKLAEYLGIDPISVSRWERGLTNPGPGAATRLRCWFDSDGTDTDSFVRGEAGLSDSSRTPGLDPAIAELVRIVGTEETLYVLRERALLRRAASAVCFPVDPATRLREVDQARREQTELIDRVTITRVDDNVRRAGTITK
jgi:transcriptional regulator with XRE-family HTH domain